MAGKRIMAAAIAATGLGLAFFFVPAAYWFSIGPAYATQHPHYVPVYRSASCIVLGYGDLYSPLLAENGYALGLALGCQLPIPIPA